MELDLKNDIIRGPGLTRINSAILDNPTNLAKIKQDLMELLDQIPVCWDPHKKLEFMKVSIRTAISGCVGRDRKELKVEIEELEENMREMHVSL